VRIEAAFHVEKIAEKAGRDTLNYVQITEWQGKPVAVAADGFCLAVVPVVLDAGDVPGPVHWTIFDAARGEQADRAGELRFKLGEDRVTFDDGWTAPRDLNPTAKPYPNWQGLIPDRTGLDDAWPAFALNPRLLSLVQEALGAQTFVTLHRVGPDTAPILVADTFLDGSPEAPFGLLMPVHSAALPTETQWHKRREAVLARSERTAAGRG
jgi:hypothetical protein